MTENFDPRLKVLLEKCIESGASDLHLSSETQPYLRIHGELYKEGEDIISAAETDKMINSMLNPLQREVLMRTQAVDIAFSVKKDHRFRAHIYKERRGLSMAARKLESQFRSLADLGLPQEIGGLADLSDGLVLVTGPTGSGKTTTLATLINRINLKRSCHILTIEDPIEYLHRNEKSLVHQRELYSDVGSFPEAVRSSLREDPDVVLIGEMRDLETMRTAITVAETGHLVFSTLHCGSAVGALDRLIGAFPANEQQSLCQQLSMVLRAVVAQRLLPTADGKGRIPAVEIFKVTKAAANLIRNYKTEQLYATMESGSPEGMITLEQSLANLVTTSKVKMDDARKATENVRIFEQRCQLAKSLPTEPRRNN